MEFQDVCVLSMWHSKIIPPQKVRFLVKQSLTKASNNMLEIKFPHEHDELRTQISNEWQNERWSKYRTGHMYRMVHICTYLCCGVATLTDSRISQHRLCFAWVTHRYFWWYPYLYPYPYPSKPVPAGRVWVFTVGQFIIPMDVPVPVPVPVAGNLWVCNYIQ